MDHRKLTSSTEESKTLLGTSKAFVFYVPLTSAKSLQKRIAVAVIRWGGGRIKNIVSDVSCLCWIFYQTFQSQRLFYGCENWKIIDGFHSHCVCVIVCLVVIRCHGFDEKAVFLSTCSSDFIPKASAAKQQLKSRLKR